MRKIDTLYAFIVDSQEDGEERIVEFHDDRFGWIPLVTGDPKRVQSYLTLAEKVAKATGKPVRFCQFTIRTEIDEIKP